MTLVPARLPARFLVAGALAGALTAPLPPLALVGPASAAGPPVDAAVASPSGTGYYRQPSLRGDTVVFVAEGDIWRASVSATATGPRRATRLTSHPGPEGSPFISPDGSLIAFIGTYEGPAAAYVMPITGGRPRRLTWDGLRVGVVGWSPDGKVLVSTDALSTLPATQLTRIDPVTGERDVVPLAQASDGTYTKGGKLIFTRLAFQGSQTARYKGGTAQNLWAWNPGNPEAEAAPLTGDFAGTSKGPMADNGRIYFLSDRDGTMNIWSMGEDGTGLAQLTHSKGWDIQSATLDPAGSPAGAQAGAQAGTRIAYRLGADIHVIDVATGKDDALPITLDSDLDQTREHWIDNPAQWISNVDLSSDGEKIAVTARGKVWVIPKTPGRVVALTPESGVRWRAAQFSVDGTSVLGLADTTGEVELTEVPADGSAPPTTLTRDADVLRWALASSPDGALIAHSDKNQRLWLYSRATGESTLVVSSSVDMIGTPTFSADGRMLAWVETGENHFHRIHIEDLVTHARSALTTSRYDSSNPVFSPDGKWLYFLSDRDFVSSVTSPWGTYGPQPYFDQRTRIFALALQPDGISPFQPWDELRQKPADDEGDEGDAARKAGGGGDKKAGKKTARKQAGAKPGGANARGAASDLPPIVVDGLAERIWTVPVPAGNYTALSANDGALYWLATGGTTDAPINDLMGLIIGNDPPEVTAVATGVDGYQLSRDGTRLLIEQAGQLSIVDADVALADLTKAGVDLSGWTFAVDPREEWRQMFVESWRLERDYFYATNMHGLDWRAMLDRYLPLVDRVRSREELSDLISQMVSQLSALHTFVRGGDLRFGDDAVSPAGLGAVLSPASGGLRIDRIYASDPDQLTRRSPLKVPGVDVREGDILLTVDHSAVSTVSELETKLIAKAGYPVLIGYSRATADARGRAGTTLLKALVTPLDLGADRDLRYLDWEIARRNRVEDEGAGRIGYIHLRAMGEADIAQWAREYYPVFNREGLIIDVRSNRGGNIDSWILGQLLRRPWMYWSQRVGDSNSWNMQEGFRGPIVVLCDANTASDGEAFAEGIKRLHIGKVIGTRTWGGEIWLSGDNFLVDGGIATAAEYGVYGPEGTWLIEGHGVEPDMVVDNLPHATFAGGDAQLDAALEYLRAELAAHPVEDVPRPAYPDKSPR
ncbi:MAG: protease [Myxococcales bacterium]|nr:protease [Myxococcales bacterium]